MGDPAFQTYFEVLALILCVEKWCFAEPPTSIFGDNVGALQEALDMKGRGAQVELAQFLAILRGARSLHLSVAHLPSESNDAADALSRQAGPMDERKAWPFKPELGVNQVSPINLEVLWGWLTSPTRPRNQTKPRRRRTRQSC